MTINEYINNYGIPEIESDEINLSSFDINNDLCQKIWDKNHLKPKIRLRLLDIADDFIRTLNINWVNPIDIIITGSIANYNWSEYSDIDIHIIMNYNDIYFRHDFVKEYLNDKKTLWNESHNELKINGFPVEMYVENIDEPVNSAGIYSLNSDKWLKRPKYIDDKFDEEVVRNISSKYMTKIDDIEKILDNETDMHKIYIYHNKLMKIYKILKELRKKSLIKNGEMSNGNIIWKVLRRFGYIDKIWKLIDLSYDTVNSIYEMKNIKNIIINEKQAKYIKNV